VRLRGLLYALSMELFGTPLTLPDFPRIKSIRGLGTSDSNSYALMLGDRLDYRNTFFDREPRFDVTNPAREEFGKYDFITSSEVFEHVLPPVVNALRNCRDLLRDNGVLVFTMPYSIEPESLEHYPDLHQFGLAEVGGEKVLVNRTAAGEWQVFENPVFHRGITGDALEVRQLNETALRALLAAAGFDDVMIYSGSYPQFGVVQNEAWSLPIAARKGRFRLRPDAVLELIEEWKRLAEGKQNLQHSFWFRVGRYLGLFPDPVSR
jgi:SAM-dependent methyltransferase